jgi:glutamyl-tRNA synthetase
VEKGSAYYCFCSAERIDALRKEQTLAKRAPRYDKHCAGIPKADAVARVAAGEPAVIRMNLPLTGQVTLVDLIRGNVTFSYDQLDDSVLLKTDGFPTYHLANVVDDHLMEMSHVIRAEEWLPSAPKHLFLYDAFGWTPPKFAHLPLLLGADHSKLSKRHGATSALSFRDEGYLPEAMRNFMVLMGWHPKGEQELLTMDEILSQFSLDHVNPSGAIFDRTKLDWMNGMYIRNTPVGELVKLLAPFWHVPEGEQPDDLWKERAVATVRDRMKKLNEIDGLINFAFASVWDAEASVFDRKTLVPKKGTAENMQAALRWGRVWLDAFPGTWDGASLKAAMIPAIADAGKKNIDVLWPLRVALTLRAASPDVFDMLALVGKEESLRRIGYFLKSA